MSHLYVGRKGDSVFTNFHIAEKQSSTARSAGEWTSNRSRKKCSGSWTKDVKGNDISSEKMVRK